jgi:hypothetical protein
VSADPFVQAPYHSQSLNRYSYVWNNPLTFVDPSGFGTCGVNGEDFSNGYLCGFDQFMLDWKDQLWASETLGSMQYPFYEGTEDPQLPVSWAAAEIFGTPTLDDLAPDLRHEIVNRMREIAGPVGPGEASQSVFRDELWARRKAHIQATYPYASCDDQTCSYPDELTYYVESPSGRTGLMLGAGSVTARGIAPLAGVLRGHRAGQGFSGVFDAATGKLLLRPSATAAPTPPGWVARAGGHADVSAALGGNVAGHSGFAVILQQDGTLAVTWLSRTLNSGRGALVPAELRPAIVKAIEEATGRAVSAF